MPDGRPLPRGAVILTRAEWERMKNPVVAAPGPPSRAEDLARRKAVSQSNTAGWTNTIKGMREQRLQAKAIRDAEYEEMRLAQDREEEQREAALRQAAIDRARALQMMESDRVKEFQRSVLAAEVMRDRKKTLGVKDGRVQKVKEQDTERAQRALDELQEAAKHEEAKAMEQRLRMMMLAEDQIQQAAQKRQARRQQLKAKEEEGQQALDDVRRLVSPRSFPPHDGLCLHPVFL